MTGRAGQAQTQLGEVSLHTAAAARRRAVFPTCRAGGGCRREGGWGGQCGQVGLVPGAQEPSYCLFLSHVDTWVRVQLQTEGSVSCSTPNIDT